MSGAFIELKDLKVKCEEAFKAGKIPFIVDPSGKADSFLTYNGNDLDAKGLFVLDKIHKKKTPEEISCDTRAIPLPRARARAPVPRRARFSKSARARCAVAARSSASSA